MRLPHSRLYTGRVAHRRRRDVAHGFAYPVALIGLDLRDAARLRRPGLVRFHRRDHHGDPRRSLDACLRELVAARAGFRPSGRIVLITQLRSVGVGFNPVRFHLCHGADDRLQAIVAEITNTPWGERHAYVLDCRGHAGPWWRFRFPKAFHISPFLPMQQVHEWRFRCHGQRLQVHMRNIEDGRCVFQADLNLRGRPAGPAALIQLSGRHLLQPALVLAAIYLHALRLWWRGASFFPHPHRRGAAHGGELSAARQAIRAC